MILNESPSMQAAAPPAAAGAGAGSADAGAAGMGGAGSAAAATIGRSQTIPEGGELAPTAEANRRGEAGAAAGGAAAGGGERRRLRRCDESALLTVPLFPPSPLSTHVRHYVISLPHVRHPSSTSLFSALFPPATPPPASPIHHCAPSPFPPFLFPSFLPASNSPSLPSPPAIFVGRGLEEAAARAQGEGARAGALAEEAEDAVAPLPQTKIALGMDVRNLFTPESVEALEKAVAADDIASMNPVLLQCRHSNRPFYAVLHRTSAAADDSDTANSSTSAPLTHRLALSAVKRLQKVAPGNISALCQVVVEEVRELTGYDRVVAYKFHEDGHGEVATRLLFFQTRSRMVADCQSPSIPLRQHPLSAPHPLKLGGSTLRAVDPCHVQYMCNMGIRASYVLAIMVPTRGANALGQPGGGGGGGGHGGGGGWRGAVCKESFNRPSPSISPSQTLPTSPFQAFGLQLSVELKIAAQLHEKQILQIQFLLCDTLLTDNPAFGLQLSGELEIATQLHEKRILQIQSLLCDTLLTDNPIRALVSSAPNIMDLLPCDGQRGYDFQGASNVPHHPYLPLSQLSPINSSLLSPFPPTFGLQLSVELEIAAQLHEKQILQIQSLLCNTLLTDNPVRALMSSAPNIMDLLPCVAGGDAFQGKAFGLQLSVELEIAAQLHEKQILQIQSLLCDTLLTDNPIRALVSSAPNIMDLLPCDGAAVLFRGELSRLGVCPSEDMIGELVRWLQREHCGSSGLSTDSLKGAGFPYADTLGVDVCGMVVVCFSPADEQQQQQQQERQQQQGREAALPVPPSPSGSSTSGAGGGSSFSGLSGGGGGVSSVSGITGDYLFWFRSHVEKSIKWSGARHNPLDVDDAKKRHPRASFKAFLEVVKHRALPWADVEVDAVHSLQDLLCKSVRRKESMGRLISMGKQNNSELAVAADELVRLIETASAPILAVDLEGNITGWNGKVAAITGLSFSDAIGQSLLDTCLDPSCVDKTRTAFELALAGEEQQQLELKLKRWGSVPQGKGPPTPYAILHVNTFVSRDSEKSIVGVCFVGQDVTEETAARTRFVRIQGDFTTIINTHNSLMPPIFATNASGFCTEWNPAMESITGLKRSQVLGCMLPGIIFGRMCQLANDDSLTRLLIMLSRAMAGQDAGGEEKTHFAFHNAKGRMVEVLLTVQQRLGGDGRAAGAFGFLHVASPELMQALAVQQKAEGLIERHSKQLAYVRQAMAGAVHGMVHARSLLHRSLLDASPLSPSAHAAPSAAAPGGKVWQFMEAMARCDAQLMRLLHTQMDPLGGGEGGGGGADAAVFSHPSMLPFTPSAPFTMASLINTAVCQAMQHAIRRSIDLTYDALPDVASTRLVGNQLLLQQVLGGITVAAVKSTPSGGTVRLQLAPSPSRMLAVEIELRIIQSGPGIEDAIIQHMFGLASCPEDSPEASYQAHALVSYRSLLRQMHGDVHYLRQPNKCYFQMHGDVHYLQQPNKCYFQVSLELPCAPRAWDEMMKQGHLLHTVAGSAFYMAPEVIRGSYGPEADLWSVGVVLYILLSGSPPFWAETNEGIFEEILWGHVDQSEEPWPQVSTEAKQLVLSLLQQQPERRPTAAQLMEHPWVREGGIAADTPLAPAVITRLKRFAAMNRLKRLTLKLIASHVSDAEAMGLREMFKALDGDGSGTISLAELRNGVERLGDTVPKEQLRQMMAAADVDSSGSIDYNEFVAATMRVSRETREAHLQQAFAHFDTDGNGFITGDELRGALEKEAGSAGVGEAEIKRIFADVDADQNGKIDYSEFCAMMEETTTKMEETTRFNKGASTTNTSGRQPQDFGRQFEESGQQSPDAGRPTQNSGRRSAKSQRKRARGSKS
ncbi:unnamed protein product [Closterium sp. NIES-65]|nr:unnamed protein product [Closterium sp. NIES-65]